MEAEDRCGEAAGTTRSSIAFILTVKRGLETFPCSPLTPLRRTQLSDQEREISS